MFGSSQWLRGHETCEADARAALGGERYATLFERGAGLNLDDAVAFAYGRAPIPNRSLSEAPAPAAASNLTHRERGGRRTDRSRLAQPADRRQACHFTPHRGKSRREHLAKT